MGSNYLTQWQRVTGPQEVPEVPDQTGSPPHLSSLARVPICPSPLPLPSFDLFTEVGARSMFQAAPGSWLWVFSILMFLVLHLDHGHLSPSLCLIVGC